MSVKAFESAWTELPRAMTRLADILAIGVAIALPWSTSLTGILIALWILAVLPLTPGWAGTRREVFTPAASLPILLWALGVVGVLWAHAPWADRLENAISFQRLLMIPLLILYFRRSENGWRVVVAYVASCTVLLALSLTTSLWPDVWRPRSPGVPVRDQIVQSAEFAMCAFGLGYLALAAWREKKFWHAAALLALILAFLGNVMFIATSRTELVVVAILIVAGAGRQWGWTGAAAGVAALISLAIVAWTSSDYLRFRVGHAVWEFQEYRTKNTPTSVGLRVAWWTKSVDLIAEAPLFGHGTGSIRSLFVHHTPVTPGQGSFQTGNPHNQALTIAIQIGLVGTAILFAMWFSQIMLFRGSGLYPWLGFVVVVQNIVGSMFNSHIFDFALGWTYVWGVGVIGGIVLQATKIQPTQEATARSSFRSDPRLM